MTAPTADELTALFALSLLMTEIAMRAAEAAAPVAVELPDVPWRDELALERLS
jgi:hypothetical protein